MPVTVPTSLDAALAAISADPDATLLAGGTDLMVEVNDGHRELRHVIALTRVPELQAVTVTDGHVEIGAGVTYTQMSAEPLASLVRALAYAARTVGSPQIRNAGTLGGNLGTGSPAGDTLPVLLALDATVVLASSNGWREMPVRDFFTGPKQTARRPGELIVATRIPLRRGPQEFLKVGTRNAMVIAVVSFALAVDLDARRIGAGLGSVGPTPLAAPDACAWLAEGVAWTPARINAGPGVVTEFGRRIRAAAAPIDDHRGTADYRRHAVGVLACRALRRAIEAIELVEGDAG